MDLQTVTDWLKNSIGYVPQQGKAQTTSGPSFSASDLPVVAGLLGGVGLRLTRKYPRTPEAASVASPTRFGIYNKENTPVGNVSGFWDPKTKDFMVGDINSFTGPNSFGHSDVRNLLNQLQGYYPDAKTVTGMRVSGARSTLSGPLNELYTSVKLPQSEIEK